MRAAIFLGRTLALCCACALPLAAAQADPSVLVDGKALACAARPLSYRGALLLPMRPVFEALQARVRWLQPEGKLEVRRGEHLVELWLGTPVAQVDHAPVQLACPPQLVAGTAYVPLRLIAQAFGATVRWSQPTQTATIATGIAPASAVEPSP